MLELRIATHIETRMMAVGYGERGAALPSDVRVLELSAGELVAQGITDRLASAHACGHEPIIDLDVLVEHAERILAVASTRLRPWLPGEGPG